ncbi:MAG: type II toxin-antitoxin system VapC family toxin, partial [bacterium]
SRIFADHVFHQRASNILNHLVKSEELLCISGQIVRELISVCSVSRFLSRALSWDELRSQIDSILSQTELLNENKTSILKLIDLSSRYKVLGKQIHDANIVATMLTHGVTQLITFNPDDFKKFKEIKVIIP